MEFNDALQNSVKLFSNPEFIKDIEEDRTMLKYLPILKKMNELGFLTIESQAGKKVKKYNIIEKAYVKGFMKKQNAEKFIKYLNIYKDKIAFIIYPVDNNIDIPPIFDIPLTITKNKNSITIDTHISTIIPKSVFNMYLKETKISNKEDVVLIFCYDNKWNRLADKPDGLFTEILQALKLL